MSAMVYPDWKAKVVYSTGGPQPQVLVESADLKVVLVGLEQGQKIPQHPAKLAVYHFLEGSGWMLVDGERIAVGVGATVIAPDGSSRGIEAETRLTVIATRVV